MGLVAVKFRKMAESWACCLAVLFTGETRELRHTGSTDLQWRVSCQRCDVERIVDSFSTPSSVNDVASGLETKDG